MVLLASVQRIDAATVEAIAAEATRTGTVVGVRLADAADDEEDAAPWTRPAVRHAASRAASPDRCPRACPAVLAQRLFVAKEASRRLLLNQIKRLAAFQNPEFYKKQSMRLSTAMTPRVIACAEDLPQHVALPRGAATDSKSCSAQHGVALEVDDERHVRRAARLPLPRHADPRPGTRRSQALLAHDTGVFVAPPGVGKTVIGTYLVAARACSTLILVHRRPLLDQWIAQLSLFLGIDPKGDRADWRRQSARRPGARRRDDPEPGAREIRSPTLLLATAR